MKTTLTIIIFLIALTASSQIITAGINYTSSGQPYAKLGFESKTFGGYIKKKNDVSWIEDKVTDDEFKTENCFMAGLTYSFDRLTINSAIGQFTTNFHHSGNSWDEVKAMAIETGWSYKAIKGRMFTLAVEGGLIYASDLQIYSGVSIGLKIR
jgi:hypothetical protein